jgi:hypothetical protein
MSGTTSLTEKGTKPNYLAMVDGKPAPTAQPLAARHPHRHERRTAPRNADTCNNWTVGRRQRQGDARHADRLGRNPGVNPWNASHPSQGCGLEQLAPTGGAGLLYCFATN